MRKKRLLAMGLAVIMGASMIGCGGGGAASSKSGGEDSKSKSESKTNSDSKSESKDSKEGGEVVVTMPTYRSGEDVGAVFFLPQV